MLLGIHNLNRSSFINGNISLLKANALLQIPTADDIAAVDPLTAEAEFDRRWDEGTRRFDAVQRGEAIPLFANEAAIEEPLVPVEDELPEGAEAPSRAADEDDLILVAEANVPQPLQIAPPMDTDGVDLPAASIEPAPGTDIEPDVQPAEPLQQSAEPLAGTPTPENVPDNTVSRAAFTAELENEVAVMRTRRESAEALAQQLQASLADAEAERAQQASLLSPQNMLLAGGALALLLLLIAGIVACLKIAGELRLQRSSRAETALSGAMQPAWMARATPTQQSPERKEPRMPEMEVVELEAPKATTGASPPAARPTEAADDLFARMDDLLGSGANLPKK